MELIKRCETFLNELGVPVVVFCRKVDISTTAYYSWRKGFLQLSNDTLQRIDSYLKQYNF